MKMDAIKHQGITFGHDVQKWSHEEIGKESGMSGRQVNRYIRLTSLKIGERFGVLFANAHKRESHANCWGKPKSVRVQNGNKK